MRSVRNYSFGGLAGCVAQSRARQTGLLVGVYHGVQSGLECDPELPWVTVCEHHHTLVGHPSLKLALAHSTDPAGWCEDCADFLYKRALLADTKVPCGNCHKDAFVTALERGEGRWTCYGCGTINRFSRD